MSEMTCVFYFILFCFEREGEESIIHLLSIPLGSPCPHGVGVVGLLGCHGGQRGGALRVVTPRESSAQGPEEL